jgi:hypothetical protein
MLFRYDANNKESVLDQFGDPVLIGDGLVRTWGDTGGKNNNTQTIGIGDDFEVRLAVNSIVDKNSLYFPGTSTYFVRANLTELTGNPDLTIFIVTLYGDEVAVDKRLMQFGALTGASGSILGIGPDSSFRYNGGITKKFGNDPLNLPPASLGVWTRAAASDTANGRFFRNGIEATSTDTSAPITPAFGSDEILIGAERGLSGSPTSDFDGNIAEVLVYAEELTDSERESIESFLINKWQIT